MNSLLVVTDRVSDRVLIKTSVAADYTVKICETLQCALKAMQERPFDFLLVDIRVLDSSPSQSPSEAGLKAAMQQFWVQAPSIGIIVMAAPEQIRQAVMAVKNGAANYLSYPLHAEEIRYVLDSLCQEIIAQSELAYLRDQFWRADSLKHLQTRNAAMEEVYSKVRSVAPTQTTVLLMGETGTGKGVLAKLIHKHSNQRDHQFISVHCGAIPDTLVESELFGHEKGAFTGAVKRRLGKFEMAKDGSIFLDEVSTITAAAQIKLLQVLQEKSFNRVGGGEEIATNARIIAASNIDLGEMCSQGSFRRDLYYRLNVFPIAIPPLRDRLEDIAYLADFFLKRLNRLNSKEIHGIHPAVLEAFGEYDWPGNIRELENLIERAYIIEKSSILTPESFPVEMSRKSLKQPLLRFDSSATLSEARRRGTEEIERCYLKETLSRFDGRINRTAEHAGITSRQLHKLMQKFNLRKEDFKS